MDDNRSLILVIIVVALAAGAWLFQDLWLPVAEPPAPVAAPPPVEDTDKELAPLHPIEPLESRDEAGELIPLPPLDDSDEYFALALLDLFGNQIEELLVEDVLIERSVGALDALPRERVPERIRPLGLLPGTFLVESTDDEDVFLLSPRNYERYDDLVALLANADRDALLATYRRFYPLFETAYRSLGYPDAYFNDRVVEVIDELLDTPQPDGAVELLRDGVLYTFRDPALESLSAGQKALLRMGPDNAKRVRDVLRTLRESLAPPG